MVLMLFFGSAGHPATAEALQVVSRYPSLFDDEDALFFGVTVDPRDAADGRIALVAYDEAGNGHFRPHRDNTTFGTAHRRFAVTINLNASEYEGGDLRFPEFGGRTYRAPTGGAVVFSCSLAHEATPVTAGKRYAFLPFLYDDAAAEVRRANRSRLADAAPLRQNAGS